MQGFDLPSLLIKSNNPQSLAANDTLRQLGGRKQASDAKQRPIGMKSHKVKSMKSARQRDIAQLYSP
jgi:hypothetical protein